MSLSSPAAGTYIHSGNDSPSFGVSGSCDEEGAIVAIRIDGAPASGQSGGMCAGGSWSGAFDSTVLTEGSHTLEATLTDASNNTGFSSGIGVTRDVTGPSWSNTISHAATDSSLTDSPMVSWSASASDSSGIHRYEYAIGTGLSGSGQTDLKAWTAIGSSPFTASELTLNHVTRYYVHMRAIDSASNASAVYSSGGWTVPPSVVAAYPANGSNWNDYVLNDGADLASSSGSPCAGSEASAKDCLHGGEIRKVVLNNTASCSGITLSDSLSAFQWTCKPVGGAAVFFSNGFQPGKGLKDLLNATSWKNLSVTLTQSTFNNSSAAGAWWSNPVMSLPANDSGSAITLDGTDDDGAGPDQAYSQGTILTLASSAYTSGYNLNADKLGIVIFAGQSLTFNGTATANCDYNSGEPASAYQCVLAAGDQKFLWIEGAIDAYKGTGNRAQSTINLGKTSSGVRFSRIHASTLTENSSDALVLNGSGSNTVSDTMVQSGAGGDGIWIALGSNGNRFVSVSANTNLTGIHLDGGSSNNSFENVVSSGNTGDGIHLASSAANNSFYGIKAFSNGGDGIELESAAGAGNRFFLVSSANNAANGISLGASSSVLSQLTISNNGTSGIALGGDFNRISHVVSTGSANSHGIFLTSGAEHNVLSQLTLANNNSNWGIFITTSANYNIIHQVALSNNGQTSGGGLGLNGASYNSFSQVASSNHSTTYGVRVASGSNYNKFSGSLLVGGNSTNCAFLSSTDPGITAACATQGASDHNFVSIPTLASAFSGKLTAEEAVNLSDSSGTATYSSALDWTGFENTFRSWGKDGSAFASSDNRGRCTSGLCRIWDWSLNALDSVIRENSGNGSSANQSFMAGSACPSQVDGTQFVESQPYVQSASYAAGLNGIEVTGDSDGVCETGETCKQRYLKAAIESLDDGTGDDDGLCESGEACLYAPNFGAYQGHGSLASCSFSQNGGAIGGVTIQGYSTNGR